MEQLISYIETYCARVGITPQKFLRDVIDAPWGQWQKWKTGEASPTMKTADRLFEVMAANGVVHTRSRGKKTPKVQPPAVEKRRSVA